MRACRGGLIIEALKPADFAELLGIPESSLPPACREAIDAGDFRYSRPLADARDAIILGVLRHIESGQATRVGEHRAALWESCWSENLSRLVGSDHDPEALVPEFLGASRTIRLKQDFAIAANARFEVDFLEVCRAFLFDRFLAPLPSVYEFGCGSGANLIAFSRLHPGKRLYGLDWSESSVETVNLLRARLGIGISGRRFDFFDPDYSLELDTGAAVVTFCALEQVGTRHASFVEFLLARPPSICVHLEPVAELYDASRLVDYLALAYHRRRGYLEGFLTALQALERARRLEILEVRRLRFGSLFHEGYSYIAWRPR